MIKITSNDYKGPTWAFLFTYAKITWAFMRKKIIFKGEDSYVKRKI